jgi:8-oxo-dGTP pyrophosphatase MutT (NUDIX family)
MPKAVESIVGSRERRIVALVDELRADVANGLYYQPDAQDRRRFDLMRRHTAELLSQVDDRSADEIEAIFAVDTGLRTPWLGVVLILNDQRRGLLFAVDERTGRPAAPHSLVAEDLDPDTAVARLAERIVVDQQLVPVPHGVCDSISVGLAMPHTYYLTYVVDVTFVAPESIAVDLIPATEAAESELDDLTAYIMGGADHTVIDAPFALPATARSQVESIHRLAVEGERETDDRYNRLRFARIAHTMGALLDGVGNDAPLGTGHVAALEARTPVTAAEALILDGTGRILLMRRSDNGQWCMPGGACEVGESSAATAVRETLEEVCLDVDIDGLIGVYDNRVIGAPDPGSWVMFLYAAHLKNPGQRPGPSTESLEAAWFHPRDIDTLDMFNGEEIKISRALEVLKG